MFVENLMLNAALGIGLVSLFLARGFGFKLAKKPACEEAKSWVKKTEQSTYMFISQNMSWGAGLFLIILILGLLFFKSNKFLTAVAWSWGILCGLSPQFLLGSCVSKAYPRLFKHKNRR